MKRIPFLPFVLFLGVAKAFSADIWVSVHGNDRNNGTQASPKATLAGALRQARELRRLKDESVKGGIHIYMQGGTYLRMNRSLSVPKIRARKNRLRLFSR